MNDGENVEAPQEANAANVAMEEQRNRVLAQFWDTLTDPSSPCDLGSHRCASQGTTVCFGPHDHPRHLRCGMWWAKLKLNYKAAERISLSRLICKMLANMVAPSRHMERRLSLYQNLGQLQYVKEWFNSLDLVKAKRNMQAKPTITVIVKEGSRQSMEATYLRERRGNTRFIATAEEGGTFAVLIAKALPYVIELLSDMKNELLAIEHLDDLGLPDESPSRQMNDFMRRIVCYHHLWGGRTLFPNTRARLDDIE